MRQPRVIAEYVRTCHEERKRLSAKANAKRAHLELRLGELNREIDRLVDSKGARQSGSIGASLECPERRAEAGCNGVERRTCGQQHHLAPPGSAGAL